GSSTSRGWGRLSVRWLRLPTASSEGRSDLRSFHVPEARRATEGIHDDNIDFGRFGCSRRAAKESAFDAAAQPGPRRREAVSRSRALPSRVARHLGDRDGVDWSSLWRDGSHALEADTDAVARPWWRGPAGWSLDPHRDRG